MGLKRERVIITRKAQKFIHKQFDLKTIQTKIYKSPIGELILGSFDENLVVCDWRYRKMRKAVDKRITEGLAAEMEAENSPVIKKAIEELDAYFAGRLQQFETPLLLVGSDFQKSVWKELLEIPYGKTMSYLGLSEKLNNEGAIRAVASANGANALSIFIPCHRVLGSDGSLTGYAGGLPAKKKLLQLEGAEVMRQTELF